MEEFIFDENYGDLRADTMGRVKTRNVSPADMTMIQLSFGEDWDRINRFIDDNTRGMLRNFYYPFGG